MTQSVSCKEAEHQVFHWRTVKHGAKVGGRCSLLLREVKLAMRTLGLVNEYDRLVELDGRPQLELVACRERHSTKVQRGHEDTQKVHVTCTKGRARAPVLKKSRKQPVFETPSFMPAFVRSLALLSYLQRDILHEGRRQEEELGCLGAGLAGLSRCAYQDLKPSRWNSSSNVATWSDPVAWKWLWIRNARVGQKWRGAHGSRGAYQEEVRVAALRQREHSRNVND